VVERLELERSTADGLPASGRRGEGELCRALRGALDERRWRLDRVRHQAGAGWHDELDGIHGGYGPRRQLVHQRVHDDDRPVRLLHFPHDGVRHDAGRRDGDGAVLLRRCDADEGGRRFYGIGGGCHGAVEVHRLFRRRGDDEQRDHSFRLRHAEGRFGQFGEPRRRLHAAVQQGVDRGHQRRAEHPAAELRSARGLRQRAGHERHLSFLCGSVGRGLEVPRHDQRCAGYGDQHDRDDGAPGRRIPRTGPVPLHRRGRQQGARDARGGADQCALLLHRHGQQQQR